MMITDDGGVVVHEGPADDLGDQVPGPLQEAHPRPHLGHHGRHEAGRGVLARELLHTGMVGFLNGFRIFYVAFT